MIKVLVMGDPHVSADDVELDRFYKAGNYLVQSKPDVFVCIGDFMTLDCLSAWDKNKRKKMEGRRYQEEVSVGNEALDMFLTPLRRLQQSQKSGKRKQYLPELYYLEGNHEERLTRYLEYDPTFEGFANIPDNLELASRGISWVPYREYLDIDGVKFTHIPHNTMKPIASAGLVTSVAKKCLQYCDFDVVFGHTHKLELAHATRASGVRHMSINVGNFASSQGEEYMHGKIADWWTGLVELCIDNRRIMSVNTIPIELL